MPVQGKGKMKVLIVFSHPAKGEEEMGRLGVSHAYMRLENDLTTLGISMGEDCWVTTAVRCYPKAVIPSKKMYECCRGKLLATVKRLKPTTVLLVGRNAVHGWIGHQFELPPQIPNHSGFIHDTDYDGWVGHKIPDQQYAFDVDGVTVCPTVIPLFNMHDVTKLEQNNMARESVNSVVPMRHKAVLAMAVDHVRSMMSKGISGYAKYAPSACPNLVKVWNVDEAIAVLKSLNKPSILSLDYETTGIKPYDKGHRILMVGLSTADATYAMPFFDWNPEFMEAYRVLMKNPKVRKVCHNLKFEYNWTRKIVGCEMQGILWDTMLVAHILDMRDAITGLKIQGYLKFGMAGYDKVTKKLLPAVNKDRGSNGKNWLQYLHSDNLQDNYHVWDVSLSYVGEDAATTRLLYIRQKEDLMDTDYTYLSRGIKLFMDSIVPLAEMEYNGFIFDTVQCKNNQKLIKEQMQEVNQRMWDTEEYGKWNKKYPKKDLNMNSPKQMQEFLYTILEYEIKNYSKKGNPSTNKDTLDEMDTPFTNLLKEYKALAKLYKTLAKTYTNEANDDGHLRCSFNLNTVKSYRTSSSDPNLQNVDHHHDISKYALNLMKPLPGHVMLNMDFKSLEVYCAAAHTGDAKLLEYLHDESTDMHRDMACEIHFYEPKELPSRLRRVAKTFTFGAFYGAGYKSIAKNQWKNYLPEDKARLKLHGVQNFMDFEQHIKRIFDNFWNVKYKQYTRWKRAQWAFYVRNGYFAGHTGFLYNGVCNVRQATNFGVQGDASHILLQEAKFMYWFLKNNNMQAKLISQVHDSLIISAPAEEVPYILEAVRQFLDQLDVINPWTKGLDFVVEAEQSEVDGNWGEMSVIAKVRRHVIEYAKGA